MLQISENAAKLIKKMTARHGIPGGGLRIAIKAGGCSGLSYTFAWEPAPRDGDLVFEGAEGSRVFVDQKSHRFLDGTTLDYDTSLVSKGFIFDNPHAKSTCGCGTSFSV
jgi:iron-sulfur cluster assembly protein